MNKKQRQWLYALLVTIKLVVNYENETAQAG